LSGTPARLGRYEILAPIGRGGMAEVFLARIVGPGGIEKRVCVKRLLPAIVADPRASQQFSSEARTALALQHANIVPVFDFGREGQELYLVMEWIDGCDLGRLLSHFGRPLPPLRAAYVAGEIARALAYAHDRGDNEASGPLVHRDVTPRNVLLSRRGEVRLTDFGIARVGGAAGALAGTPRYMSSEQACGERARPADDVYALGLVLAEMLTGRPVRSTNSLEEAKAPVDPPEIPTAGPELQQIVGAMLAPDPAARLARAAEVQAALGRVLADAVLRGEGAPAEALSQDVAAAAVPAPDRFGAPAAP